MKFCHQEVGNCTHSPNHKTASTTVYLLHVITHIDDLPQYHIYLGHAVAQLVEATSRKVAGSIPDVVIGFFSLT